MKHSHKLSFDKEVKKKNLKRKKWHENNKCCVYVLREATRQIMISLPKSQRKQNSKEYRDSDRRYVNHPKGQEGQQTGGGGIS